MKTNKWIRATLLAVASLIASTQVNAQFKVVGYMPSWSGDVNAIQYSKLTHINYAFLLPTATGGLQAIENASKLSSLVTKTHAAGKKVLIAVGGWNDGDDSNFESLAGNSTYRTNFVNNLVSFCNQYGLDGVDIDWEYPDAGTSANNYVSLMTQLGTALHNQGKLLTAAVVGTGGASILSSVFSIVDFLNIMAYDYNNYDHSTYTYASQAMTYWTGRGLAKSKAILGVPFYGRPSWETYAALVARGASPNSDTYQGVGYNGIPTIKAKTDLAYANGGGIMIWELSGDATGANSLVSAIATELAVLQGGSGGTTTIQAENYTSMSGVETESTTDAGGGLNVGYIDTGDWMAYANINFPSSGTYKIEYRVASESTGGTLSLDLNAGSIVLGTLSVPATGGWQTWQTISHNVTVSAGTYALGIYAAAGGWNLNWIKITKVTTAKAATVAAVADVHESSSVIVYPNPVVTDLHLKGKYAQTGGYLTVYDLNGKQVLNVKSGVQQIAVGSLPAGTYLLIYTKGEERITQKFVKQ
jgi:GH18 family chitinase